MSLLSTPSRPSGPLVSWSLLIAGAALFCLGWLRLLLFADTPLFDWAALALGGAAIQLGLLSRLLRRR